VCEGRGIVLARADPRPTNIRASARAWLPIWRAAIRIASLTATTSEYTPFLDKF
jgi:hypothetical protein